MENIKSDIGIEYEQDSDLNSSKSKKENYKLKKRSGIIVTLFLLVTVFVLCCDKYCFNICHFTWFSKPCKKAHSIDCNSLRAGLSPFEFDRIVTSRDGNTCYVTDVLTVTNKLLKVNSYKKIQQMSTFYSLVFLGLKIRS